MKKVVCIASLITICAVSMIHAEQLALQPGGWEVRTNASLDPKGAFGTTFDIDLGLGHFVMQNFEIGGFIGYNYSENGGDTGNNAYSIEPGLFIEYNFDKDWLVVPYVGCSVSWVKIDRGANDDSSFIFGGKVGVKYFMTENWALDGSFHIDLANEEIFMDDGDPKDVRIGVAVGIRVYY